MSPFMLVSILAGPILALVIVVGILKRLGGEQKEVRRILQTGQPAQARVLQLLHTGASVSIGAHRHLRLVIGMEVHVPDHPPYQVGSEQLVSELTLPSLQPGSWLQICVDTQNPQKVAIASYGASAVPSGFGKQAAALGLAPGASSPGGYGAVRAAIDHLDIGPPMTGLTASHAPTTMNQDFRRIILRTVVISVIATVPFLAVSVDWSAFMRGGDDRIPDGGYCKALLRCCKTVFDASGQCNEWENLPAPGCEGAYESYKESARALGKTCD